MAEESILQDENQEQEQDENQEQEQDENQEQVEPVKKIKFKLVGGATQLSHDKVVYKATKSGFVNLRVDETWYADLIGNMLERVP